MYNSEKEPISLKQKRVILCRTSMFNILYNLYISLNILCNMILCKIYKEIHCFDETIAYTFMNLTLRRNYLVYIVILLLMG
jgi:hypothetical protein